MGICLLPSVCEKCVLSCRSNIVYYVLFVCMQKLCTTGKCTDSEETVHSCCKKCSSLSLLSVVPISIKSIREDGDIQFIDIDAEVGKPLLSALTSTTKIQCISSTTIISSSLWWKGNLWAMCGIYTARCLQSAKSP